MLLHKTNDSSGSFPIRLSIVSQFHYQQITVYSSYDNISSIFQIVDLEDGILQLKEDLIHERTEARQEKRQLKKAIVRLVLYLNF